MFINNFFKDKVTIICVITCFDHPSGVMERKGRPVLKCSYACTDNDFVLCFLEWFSILIYCEFLFLICQFLYV